MDHIFRPRGFFRIKDGTDLSPFLNATDANQMDVPWGVLGDMSIAAGRIGPKIHPWVHVQPFVTQATYLISGTLSVRMKDSLAARHYDLNLCPGDAVVTALGTLLQFRNNSEGIAEVLYII
jgi:hypothetical protein